MALQQTQKTLLQPDVQSTDIILTTGPIPNPRPNSSEHLVRVHATAITNGELLWEKNFPNPEPYASTKQLVPCFDVSGTVITAPSSSPFQSGDEVYGRSNFQRTGCAREYTILVTEEMAVRPQKLTWAESATVPMSAETAWQTLFVHAGLEAKGGKGAKGLRVFVTAASGGVGTWVVQLAKWAGAEVVATCGPANVEWVLSLGASEVLDHTKTDIKEWANQEGKKADLVIDCIGRKSLADAWWAVKDGGSLISLYQPPEQMKPAGFKRTVKDLFFIVESSGEQLEQITKLIEGGVDRMALDSVYPLDKFQEAFDRVESRKTRGKVVLDMGVY
jgi:NADPH:quinone reductase-like Zn-dependent oxidoreductase